MPAAERKRPFYLVLALLGALALGTAAARRGWETFALYHDPIDPSIAGQGIADEADRIAVVARAQAYLQTLDAARARAWPLGVDTLLIGGAMFLFAIRALGGSGGARAALIQLAVAQAGTNAASYWLLRDVADANLRVFEAQQAAEIHERMPDRSSADAMERTEAHVLRVASPVAFGLQTLGNALVIVALTRRRSRAFFSAVGEAVEGP
jgi:hypothetical protein